MVRSILKSGLLFLALWSPVSYAGTIGSNPANPVIALLKMSLALAVVLGLLWGFTALLKRFQAPSLQSKSGLKLISTYNLGQREKLLVMQVGDQQLLLGVSSSSISTLHVLPAPLDLQTSDETGSFKKTLNAAINREISA
ncbi:MAG: flagellar biosynthetic protein FliO [Granulosicoccaceae bacterium]